jgi:Cdc6-like AAA superfamily ATPase
MFKIVKSDEPLQIDTINILIYGEPGSGKTSLVNTALKPLTLDFDKGVHRSEFRKDVMVIESWKQINNNMSGLIKTFNEYDTIILDTIDTLLDYIGAWIVDQEPKLARNKLQFFGRLKDEFSLFVGKLKTLGKDVVMIAHVKEKDEGDLRIKLPAITG